MNGYNNRATRRAQARDIIRQAGPLAQAAQPIDPRILHSKMILVPIAVLPAVLQMKKDWTWECEGWPGGEVWMLNITPDGMNIMLLVWSADWPAIPFNTAPPVVQVRWKRWDIPEDVREGLTLHCNCEEVLTLTDATQWTCSLHGLMMREIAADEPSEEAISGAEEPLPPSLPDKTKREGPRSV